MQDNKSKSSYEILRGQHFPMCTKPITPSKISLPEKDKYTPRLKDGDWLFDFVIDLY